MARCTVLKHTTLPALGHGTENAIGGCAPASPAPPAPPPASHHQARDSLLVLGPELSSQGIEFEELGGSGPLL